MLSEDKGHEAITEGTCPRCGRPLRFRERPDTIHYGELCCVFCERHIKWMSRTPERKRQVPSKYTVEEVADFHGFSKAFCFFCGRDKIGLAKHETLTTDHIIPRSEGGEDKPSNLEILCNACHTLKNWVTTYLRKHHQVKSGDSDE